MKLIINGLLLNGTFSGVQYSIEYLLLALKHIVPTHRAALLLPKDYDAGRISCDDYIQIRPVYNRSHRLWRILWENTILPLYLLQHKNIIYHSMGYVLPVWCPSKKIVTIHDLIALKFPEYCSWQSALYFKLVLPRTIQKADHIITVSETVKQDIIESFKIVPEKISVIYHGIRPMFKKTGTEDEAPAIAKKYGLPAQYVLFVGNQEPKKNLSHLLEAISILNNRAITKTKLVIVGQKAWKYKPIYKTLDRLKLQHHVTFTGYVPEKDLPFIYSLASVFVFPSLYEGFGLPILEAMACGVPVITSDAGALPEIAGDAAMLVDPYNPHHLADAIDKMNNDNMLRQQHIDKGYERASKFSWSKAALETMAVYKKMGFDEKQ